MFLHFEVSFTRRSAFYVSVNISFFAGNEIFALALATGLLSRWLRISPDCVSSRRALYSIKNNCRINYTLSPRSGGKTRANRYGRLPTAILSWGRRHNAEDLKIGDFYARRSEYVSR